MGYHKTVYLYCNGRTKECECPGDDACSGDNPMEFIAEHRKQMRKKGWLFKTGNLAYCPACRAILKQLSL